jgi:glycosyltransferase involved in cell wall biosynthesis
MTPDTPTREPRLRLVLLGPANVVHTQRWVEALHERGVDVVLVTQHDEPRWQAPEGVRVVRLPRSGSAGYFLNVPALRRLLHDVRPDLLHAHYASGYGTLAALAGFRPWLLSVWGSDVYDFPAESAIKGWLLRRNLRRADAVASTSEAMARQVRRLTDESLEIVVTPFGVDTTHFAPAPSAHPGFVVGTVKTLAPKYGIDTLLRGYAAFVASRAAAAAEGAALLVVGDGPQRAELEALARSLGVADRVRFVGAVAHAEVPDWLNRLDVYVAMSRLDSESFGVAAVEASACALPVLVSDVDGLREVVIDRETGLVLPRDDAPALARALAQLFDAPDLRARLGQAGRQHVMARYEWQRCVDAMLACYARLAPAGGDVGPIGAAVDNLVSVIVPCRNELDHIDTFCSAVLQQVLPANRELEIIVADGASSDGTAEHLAARAAVEPRLHVVANPRRIVSTGLNLALRRARGAIIVRMDVHTDYAPDYVAQCIATLGQSDADNVGGPWRAEAEAKEGPMQAAIAAAFQAPSVAGGALSRRLDYDGPADTVYLGAWPRATFERFGAFDESLVRNQDDEHNLRITRGGGRVWQSSRIRSTYRPRARLGQVFRQYLQYGYWKPFVMRKHGQPARLRHLLPALFVLALALGSGLALAGYGLWPLLGLVGLYGAAVMVMSVDAVAASPAPLAVWLRVPLVIVTYHLAYGIGTLVGAFDALVRRRGSARFAKLSR